ncbi:ceb6ebd7-d2dd-4df9-b858-b5492e28aaa2-CDS [Sclerotinia trifoliorum]|uniref:Ceb6ebd7-d2dd-4df9-b858-b5492e28aaa2-CDS n=1 Tax=Sclerotinia trifoliorum TaxID=28548 RepID=A0A8H2ZRT9_9HELO|nr:ceb6ebd7-d2dd-4df9-b858-b5492e28aaa2-CDS [Sclerotinia trifoliorum]
MSYYVGNSKRPRHAEDQLYDHPRKMKMR